MAGREVFQPVSELGYLAWRADSATYKLYVQGMSFTPQNHDILVYKMHITVNSRNELVYMFK